MNGETELSVNYIDMIWAMQEFVSEAERWKNFTREIVQKAVSAVKNSKISNLYCNVIRIDSGVVLNK